MRHRAIGRKILNIKNDTPMSEYNGIHVQRPDQEIAELKRWKREATQLLNPILKKGEEIGGRLGESLTARVLNRLDFLEQENAEQHLALLNILKWPPGTVNHVRAVKDAEEVVQKSIQKPVKVDNRELPCTMCDDGEMIRIGFTQPNGQMYFECDSCGYETSFP